MSQCLRRSFWRIYNDLAAVGATLVAFLAMSVMASSTYFINDISTSSRTATTGPNGIAPSQFLRFLLTGGFAAAVSIGSRYLFNFAMPFELAVVVAYLCGMATAFALARLFVFEASGR